MPAARDAAIVAGLRRRLATADAVTLTNFAWFAARRGAPAVALDAVRRALLLRDAPASARRALELLSAGHDTGLLLVPPSAVQPTEPPNYRSTESPNYRTTDLPNHRTTDHRSPVTKPTSDELLQSGRHLLSTGQLAEALRTFEQLLSTRPADAAALFHRGVVLAKLRRYGEALRDWESVGRADPTGQLGAISRRHARSARELALIFTNQ